jgi:pimeloyl-ACP methyl ester carboxylesterase
MVYVLVLLLFLFSLALAGYLSERRTVKDFRRRVRPTGRKVDVGGHALHVIAMGEKRPDRPTVILESGMADWSGCWRIVQPEIAHFTRVIAYDRAGFSWSDPGPLPRTPLQLAGELHAILEQTGETGPYLLVGHSMGSALMRLFASIYPDEVVGMVWVDPAHENLQKFLPFWPQAYQVVVILGRLGPFLSRLGLVRRLGQVLIFSGYPAARSTEAREQAIMQASDPSMFITTWQETAGWYNQANWARRLDSFDHLPVIMLQARYNFDPPWYWPRKQWKQFVEGWGAAQVDLSGLCADIVRIPVDGGHVIQGEQPERVVEAVRDMLEQIQVNETRSGTEI